MRQPHKHKSRAERFRDSIKTYRVQADDTLLNYLLTMFKDQSRTSVKSLLTHRQVAVNNSPTTKYDVPVHIGDEIK